MRVDQLDEASRKASRDQTGSDIDPRRLMSHHRDFAAEIARAFRSRQPASAPEDPLLVGRILATFDDLSGPSRRPAEQRRPVATPVRVPPVPLPETIGLGFLVCLEDGRSCRDLGRHLDEVHGLTPAEYRRRWGLPAAYPMLPPASHHERVVWRRRLAPEPDGSTHGPITLRLQEESRRVEAGRSRRRHRRGAPAGVRHDWAKAGAIPDRRSEGPRTDGFRR
ncbi:MucR family transcriptional regulator [Inquilinus limosus]|uniref:MucR family transcriptional regulator n=1 Tax=Inquilinus limosus TaxID=171674 RepID=UPI003F177595